MKDFICASMLLDWWKKQKNDILVGSSKVTLKTGLCWNKSNGMKGTYKSMSLILNAAIKSAFFLKTSVLLVWKEEKGFVNVCIYILQQISISVTCFSSAIIKISYFTSQEVLRMSRPSTDLMLFLFSGQCISIQLFCAVTILFVLIHFWLIHSFSIWNHNLQQNLTFHIDIIWKQLFSGYLMWHFNTK
jgi:hypothetical protein